MAVEHRKNPRRSVIRNAVIVDGHHTLIAQCTVFDLSAGGARLRIEGDAQVPEKFTLWLASNGTVRRDCRIVWRERNEMGVQFQPAASGRPVSGSSRLAG